MQSLLPMKAVRSLSLDQVHALSLLAFCSTAMALVAPLLLPQSPADDCLTAAAAAAAGNALPLLLSGWPARLAANVAGYASVLLPLYLAVWLARGWDYAGRGPAGSAGWLPAGIRLLACGGGDAAAAPAADQGSQHQQQQQQITRPYSLRWCLHLSGCFLGLQAAYLTWGLLQERMMTFDYDNGERFRDSQFLVFANRALGGLLALPLMALLSTPDSDIDASRQAAATAPAFEYVYSSLSNILSSWCQYEALVYVTFPTQVLAKASKIIPVMLMGRLVSRRSYRLDEYFTSGLISLGTAMFLLSSSPSISTSSDPGGHPTPPTSSALLDAASGATLLTGYLVFDAFTSSWQSRLFQRHRVSALQMLAGSSLVSCLATVAAQLQQGSLASAVAFAGRHPLFAGHLGALAVCSTLGQLVIYHTIDRFGPVTFTVIMTVRQGFAILVSCLVYQHRMSGAAWLGVAATFAALFLRIYFGHRQQLQQQQLQQQKRR